MASTRLYPLVAIPAVALGFTTMQTKRRLDVQGLKIDEMVNDKENIRALLSGKLNAPPKNASSEELGDWFVREVVRDTEPPTMTVIPSLTLLFLLVLPIGVSVASMIVSLSK